MALQSSEFSGMRDEQLVLAFRGQRSEAAFTELVKRYNKKLKRFVEHMSSPRTDVDRIVQDAWLSVFTKIHTFDDQAAFRPWVFTIARNTAVSLFRSEGKQGVASLDIPVGNGATMGDTIQSQTEDPSVLAELSEAQEVVRAALGKISEMDRKKIALVYMDGLKYNDAASSIDMLPGTFRSGLHAAILRLGKKIDALFPQYVQFHR